uniref:Uncharacterized protein n=1 Tax=Ananas comosus var. bracteatus TaxID=296719 RepID=A0A6V7P507_ANACO|nr:unnamed protein product [Ananas comosus var. bracteatus]
MGSDLGKGGGGDVGDRGRRPWHGRLRQGAATSARAATSVTGGGDLSTGGDVGDRGRRPQHGRRRRRRPWHRRLRQGAATSARAARGERQRDRERKREREIEGRDETVNETVNESPSYLCFSPPLQDLAKLGGVEFYTEDGKLLTVFVKTVNE